MPNKISDLTGNKFGRLTVLKINGKTKSGNIKWLCLCDCGNKKSVASGDLKKKNRGIKSCGCLYKESSSSFKKKHGDTGTPTFISWSSMLLRCSKVGSVKNTSYYKNNIEVCPEWKNSYESFKRDMGERPEGTSLDRIDNELGYYKENCRWTSYIQQNNNKSDNRTVTYNGKSMTVAQWSRKLNIPYSTLSHRLIYRGWSIPRSLEYGVPRNAQKKKP